MLGAALVVIVMLVVGPATLFVAGAAWSAALGGALEAARRDPVPARPPTVRS